MAFGFVEALLLAGVVIGLFGLGKLPTVMGDLAKGIRSFKDELRGPAEPPPGQSAGDRDRTA